VRRAFLVGIPVGLAGVIALLAIEVRLARRAERIEPFDRSVLDGSIGGESASPLRIAWLGDSTGAGVGASSPDNALPRVVARGLRRPVDLTVLAESGARVRDVLDDQIPLLQSLRPDWVIVGIGGNDVTHLTSRASFRSDLADVLRRSAAVGAERVVLVGIGEFAATPLLAQPLRAIAGMRADRLAADQKRVARERGALFVDVIEATGAAFVRDPKRYHAHDGFHPSDDGYALWADAVLSTIEATRG